ncbi:MAG: branched-chain amino acid ABC transporter permease [Proteobacteria bacterium]|nr:branched-chain amino acid ABC transporter permease [Pseudomonadota bacterium]
MLDVLTQVAQLALNGIMTGAVLAMPAIGFTLLYAVLGFPNFAVSGHLAVGAFAGWILNTHYGWPLWAVVPFGFIAAGVLGVATQRVVVEPLRGAASITLAIASVAVALLIENALRFGFGNTLRSYDLPLARDVTIGALRFGPQQMQTAAVAIVVMLLLFALLRYTRLGRAIRATADNASLAAVKGIDTVAIARLVAFVGMGLAGASGVLLGADTAIDPLIGFRLVLAVFAAAVVGGLGSIPGAVLGALVIGIAEEVSTIVLPSDYKSAVGFLLILLFLTFRPRGLLGERRN